MKSPTTCSVPLPPALCVAKGLLMAPLSTQQQNITITQTEKINWEFAKDLINKLLFFLSSLRSQCCQKGIKDFSLFIGINLLLPPNDNCSLVKAVRLTLIYLFSEYLSVSTEMIKLKIVSSCNGLTFSMRESSKCGSTGSKGQLPRAAAHTEASM